MRTMVFSCCFGGAPRSAETTDAGYTPDQTGARGHAVSAVAKLQAGHSCSAGSEGVEGNSGAIERVAPGVSRLGSVARRTDSMKQCLGIAHYSFIKDVVTTSHVLTASRHNSVVAILDGTSTSNALLAHATNSAAATPHIASSSNTQSGALHTPSPAPAAMEPHQLTLNSSTEQGAQAEDDYVLLAVSEALPKEMARERWSCEDYVVHQELHRGHSSVVYKVSKKKMNDCVSTCRSQQQHRFA